MRAAALLLLVACSKQADGLPPATEWNTDDPVAAAGTMPSKPQGGFSDEESDDPHRGVPGAPPIAGGGKRNPHEGVPGAPPIPDNAEVPGGTGGTGATADVTKLGYSSPDPNRPIDPTRHIKGFLKLDAKIKDRVKPGDIIFLMVRKAGADGMPTGAPIAVDRTTWSGDAVPFELGEKQAMIAGAPDLVDHDQDAMTRQPGDITGMTKVTIPADGVTVNLDTLLQ